MGSSNSKPRWATVRHPHPLKHRTSPVLEPLDPEHHLPGLIVDVSGSELNLPPPTTQPSKVAAWKIYYDTIGWHGGKSEKDVHLYYIPAPYNFVIHFGGEPRLASTYHWENVDNKKESVIFTRAEVDYWWDLYKKQEELKAAVRGLRDPLSITPSTRDSTSSDE